MRMRQTPTWNGYFLHMHSDDAIVVFQQRSLANLRVSPGSCDLCALYHWNIIRIEFSRDTLAWHCFLDSK